MDMDENTRSRIKAFIKIAREDLSASKELLDKGFYRASINRAFYACYHMINAALLSQGVDPAHMQKKKDLTFVFKTIFTFDNNFIDKSATKNYDRLRELRREVERDPFVEITKEEANKSYEYAKDFMEKLL